MTTYNQHIVLKMRMERKHLKNLGVVPGDPVQILPESAKPVGQPINGTLVSFGYDRDTDYAATVSVRIGYVTGEDWRRINGWPADAKTVRISRPDPYVDAEIQSEKGEMED